MSETRVKICSPKRLVRVLEKTKIATPILVAVAALIVALLSLVSQRETSAWQIVNAEVCGNSGKIRALEHLRRRHELLGSIDFLWARRCSIDRYVFLEGVNLRGANLDHARLIATWLNNSNLTRAKLRFATLHNVNMRDARLDEADLTQSELLAVDLRRARLHDATLRRTDLRRADFRLADLRNADLTDADLRGADLRKADLRSADLSYADLRTADLRGANLAGTNMSGALLHNATGASLDGAWAWENDPPKGLPVDELSTVWRCSNRLRDKYEGNDLQGQPSGGWWRNHEWWWRPCSRG